MTRRVLVVGSGQRVRKAALPALAARPEAFQIARVVSRKPKTIATEGAGPALEFPVEALAELASLDGFDLVYVCVSKGAVPAVLAQLAELAAASPGGVDLLIDTPVLLFKHLGSYRHFAAFRDVWVAEDMWTLPWVETLERAAEHYQLGPRRALHLDRSAFAYHGQALAKTLIGSWRLARARRRTTGITAPSGEACHLRDLRFHGGARVLIDEPRNYAEGRLTLTFAGGTIADHARPDGPGEVLRLETILGADDQLQGFRVGAVATQLAPHELELAADPEGDPAAGAIARMDALKRVGFARLLDRIAAGRGAYPLVEAIDDMWVDYLLEKTGRWLATPLTSARSGLARGLAGGLMNLALKVKG